MRSLASRSVRHAVVTFDVGINLRTDVHLVDRHRLVLVTSNRWLLLHVTSNALVLKSPLQDDAISFVHLVGAGEARKRVCSIAAEGSGSETSPVVTTLLLC